MDIPAFLVREIKQLHKTPVLIGIDGGQGSGKSTFIKELESYLDKNTAYSLIFLETDDFLVERSQRENLPPEFFKEQKNLGKLFNFKRMADVIKEFQKSMNKTVGLDGLYNTLTGKRDRSKEYEFKDINIILIGGPYLLEKNYPKFDIKIFLSVSRENRLQNTLVRTLAKQRTVDSQKELFNKFELFYNPYFTQRLSEYDLFIDNSDFNNRKIITQENIIY